MNDEIWDLWISNAGSTGLSFARARVDGDAAVRGVLVHAPPPLLEATIRHAGDGKTRAQGRLERTGEGPMVHVVREGSRLVLDDRWPTQDDLGLVVVLPGGEAGILTAWENADDLSWWRWSVEFANSR